MGSIVSYLTAPSSILGTLGWIFFIAQIVGVGVGAYLTFLHIERNMARQTFMRQLGTALMIVGGVGVLLGALRMLNVPVLNQHLWFWIQALVELGIAGYIFYYMRNVLPTLERQSVGRRPMRQATAGRSISTAETAPATPRPVATTGRRDARRERKRRKG